MLASPEAVVVVICTHHQHATGKVEVESPLPECFNKRGSFSAQLNVSKQYQAVVDDYDIWFELVVDGLLREYVVQEHVDG